MATINRPTCKTCGTTEQVYYRVFTHQHEGPRTVFAITATARHYCMTCARQRADALRPAWQQRQAEKQEAARQAYNIWRRQYDAAQAAKAERS